MRKVIIGVICAVILIFTTAFGTYRLVMKNLEVSHVSDNSCIVTVFGESDWYYIN